MRSQRATFANFICHFGDQKVLLDYAEEIAVPAFTNDTFIRSYGTKTHYHFFDVKLVKLGSEGREDVLGLAGRFVKNTTLTREQIFDEAGGLQKNKASMQSAPSAFFVLILNNHRLIYFPETANAPDLNAFKATSQKFLKEQHRRFITRLYEESNSSAKLQTKSGLIRHHPVPELEIIPLTGADSISDFVGRYETLKRIDFRIVRPNPDLNAGEVLGEVREFADNLGATHSKLTTSNNKGLDHLAAIDSVKAATQTGNQNVNLSGVDANGNKLTGNNDKFKISAEISSVPPTTAGLTKKLYEVFNDLKSTGAIIAPIIDSAADKINSLKRLL